MTQPCVTLYVICADADEARTIAGALVAEKLIACANILAPVTSVYEWQGKVEEGAEVPMMLKTTAALAERATSRIAALHSYDVPCITVWPISGGHAPYLDWIFQSVSEP